MVVSASAPGPRDYTAATERALYAFAQASCYFPDCAESVIVFVEGEPVSNVEIAHIRGARPGAPRYDPDMTDDRRRAFPNLILLCTAHHKVIDRLHPERYPAQLLADWKATREHSAGIATSSLSAMTDEHLIELIEQAVSGARPRREVAVEIGLGFSTATGVASLPSERASGFFEMYRHLGPPVLILTARCVGSLQAYVNGFGLRFNPPGARLLGTDHYPERNPTLPAALDVGQSLSWLFDLAMISTMVEGLRRTGNPVDALVGEAHLGSGETVCSDPLPARWLASRPDAPTAGSNAAGQVGRRGSPEPGA
jgi:hypothetical protein